MRFFQTKFFLTGFCLVFLCFGFAQAQKKESINLDLSVEATAGVNPNDKGVANPIQIRIFELKKSEAFEAADYFALANSDKSTLGADLLEKDDFILRPSEKKQIQRPAHPETTALGILAGYENTSHSTWSAVYKLPAAAEAGWYRFLLPAKKVKLRIQLQASSILLTELN